MKELYSLLEIMEISGKSECTIRKRVEALEFTPTKKEGTKAFFFTKKQMQKIVSLKTPFAYNSAPEIIYVTREVHYFESQSNHYTPEKIDEIMREFGN